MRRSDLPRDIPRPVRREPEPRPAAREPQPEPRRKRARHPSGPIRNLVSRFVRVVALFNLFAIVGFWIQSGGITSVHDVATVLASIGRITGLLGAYALLIQILLLARLPFLEWIAGFDRLTRWHKINGKITLYLILAHVGFTTAGYALIDRLSFLAQLGSFVRSYPGMVPALIATILLGLVVVTSFVIVRRRLEYHTWFLVHLMAYSAVALAWFHQIPSSPAFITNPLAAAFWTGLYVSTLQLILLFRFGQPILRNLWYRLRVAEVIREGPDVVSLRITGHHLDWLHARAGQFFLWRFLDGERWQEAHPFSLSAAPDGRSLRITVKALGDYSRRLGEIRPGTRVLIEGPFGSFTDTVRSREHVLLVAGGVGITPIRALLEEMSGDLTLIYRAVSEDDLLFRDELERLARQRGITVHYVTGDHRKSGNERLLSLPHLRSLVPDIGRREIYLCGPPALMRAVLATIRQAGVPGQHIHLDAFAY